MSRSFSLLSLAGALALATPTFADDVVSFATGGYAAGLRTTAMMNVIDANGDHHVSQDEWTEFQQRSFAALDRDRSGKLDSLEYFGRPSESVSFATGAYARGLRSQQMFGKLDSDGDNAVSREEFLRFQAGVFAMMDTHKTRRLSITDFITQQR
jgi:hypothetical protein